MSMWIWITWSFLFLLVCFILYSGYIYYIHMKYDHIPGPPRDSFFFGHLPSILRVLENNGLVHDLFLEWVQKYGPVIRMNTFHNVKILLCNPEGIKEILMSPKYKKDAEYRHAHSLFGERFMGNGLVTDEDNDHWSRQRKVMDPAFKKDYLIELMETFNEKVEEMEEKLSENADGESQIVMHEMLRRVTLDVIAKAAFGLELGCHTLIPQAISVVTKGLNEALNPLAKYIPWKQAFIREVQRNTKLLRETGRECIKRRQKAKERGHQLPNDVLTQILNMADLEKDCDLENLVDNFVTLIIGGMETTANFLSFAVMELAQNPEILEKVQLEVDGVMQTKKDIEYDDLEQFEYLTQVLKETLRLYPPAPGTSRALENEIVIDGVRIPPRVTVMVNSYIMGRLDHCYHDPLIFNPDRFHPDEARPYFSYFPFSLGPRSCIGKEFAQMMSKVIIAKLVHNYHIKLVEGQTYKILGTGTLHLRDGLICRLRHRTLKRIRRHFFFEPFINV
ncbi:cholesterol 24-hydroxylase-like isoform X1 [Phyllobates terribilis]|uniref:cholesterol 24-hydroxylase-like isoform X1 n=1 Tax=Phyllobates terribilis TaxID=111132 RepID=UPI003CCB6275